MLEALRSTLNAKVGVVGVVGRAAGVMYTRLGHKLLLLLLLRRPASATTLAFQAALHPG
jgi:hypothetical protein